MFRPTSSSTAARLIQRAAAVRCFSSQSSTLPVVGFIGLGNMGLHMCTNLVKNGYTVRGYDLSAESLKKLSDKGGNAATTAKDAATGADVIITMLPSSPHVVDLYTNPETGLLPFLKRNALLIDCSTIDPVVAKELAAKAKQAKVSMVDAPVSGGTIGAENATLTFMVGGSDGDYERAHSILSKMGKNIVHCGDAGTGQVAKICNNLILGISMAGVSEAFALGLSLGIDPKKLANIVNTSSGRCWSSDTYNPCPGVMENVPAARGYTGGFGCDLMAKDLGLAVSAANATRSPLAMGALAHQMYTLMRYHGGAGKDFSAIFEMLNTKPKP